MDEWLWRWSFRQLFFGTHLLLQTCNNYLWCSPLVPILPCPCLFYHPLLRQTRSHGIWMEWAFRSGDRFGKENKRFSSYMWMRIGDCDSIYSPQLNFDCLSIAFDPPAVMIQTHSRCPGLIWVHVWCIDECIIHESPEQGRFPWCGQQSD